MKAPKANPSEIEVLVESLQPDTWLIIDHSLGGGANHYRNEQINQCLAQGHEAILWTFAPAILQFQVILHRRTAEEPCAYRVPWLALEAVLRSERVNTIMLNNCVSFPQPERVPLALLGALSRRPLRLIMCLHDFHWVCPSHFLLDNERRFCGVPDLSRCRQCLPAIQDQLASLYLAKDIDRWRSLWASLLNQATEVRCFSNSARALLNRAYPALPEGTVTVVPHRVHALPGGFDYPSDASGAFCVAVVGAISAAKGSHVVKALSAHAARTSRSLRLVVVGELHESGLEGNIVQTGPYKPEQLAGLLRTHGVHLALMPSVVAETFSYVTHELMQLGVPVMCFSLGAQAEAVARYTRGKVVPLDSSTPELLAALYAFKTDLDSRFEFRI
ncbi:MAG: glycosyltransferase family 4 protein [Ramlibacter sp.]|nr:glycosyltransferase family 4 protein [Ramlibacter sp.]